ncbi:hypothetical protein [Xylocopilactobacillus apis]|uniref:Uncharacterized protein n=1 Tax=Xylocopilactobacillus apis TaxID=2932183 RepID=A0AAU9DQR2_9LACO|nr:hypothetical protein [Xylocopilactobacillus apis]BDR55938.1 hypothetical protein KIMC2_05000 [Xylocopilactobacillus apis]
MLEEINISKLKLDDQIICRGEAKKIGAREALQLKLREGIKPPKIKTAKTKMKDGELADQIKKFTGLKEHKFKPINYKIKYFPR